MAVDMFLNIEGPAVKGEATDDKHKEWIDILAWSWGVSSSSSAHTGGGAGSGKANITDISITSYYEKSTHELFKSCTVGTHHAKITLICRKAGGEQVPYITYVFEKCFVTSVSLGGSGGDRLIEAEIGLGKRCFRLGSRLELPGSVGRGEGCGRRCRCGGCGKLLLEEIEVELGLGRPVVPGRVGGRGVMDGSGLVGGGRFIGGLDMGGFGIGGLSLVGRRIPGLMDRRVVDGLGLGGEGCLFGEKLALQRVVEAFLRLVAHVGRRVSRPGHGSGGDGLLDLRLLGEEVVEIDVEGGAVRRRGLFGGGLPGLLLPAPVGDGGGFVELGKVEIGGQLALQVDLEIVVGRRCGGLGGRRRGLHGRPLHPRIMAHDARQFRERIVLGKFHVVIAPDVVGVCHAFSHTHTRSDAGDVARGWPIPRHCG